MFVITLHNIFENSKCLPKTNKISSICLDTFFYIDVTLNGLLKIVIMRLIFYVFQFVSNLIILYFVPLQTITYIYII